MKSGYDQFFKKAQKIAADRKELPPKKSTLFHSRPQDPEAQILIEQLRSKIRTRPQKKKTKSIQWKPVMISLLGVLVTGMGFVHIEKVESFFHKIEVTVMGSAFAAEPPVEAKAEATSQKDKSGKETASAQPEEVPAKKEFTAEEINHFSKLNERKRELDAREEELARLEQELTLQKTEIEKRLNELEANRKNISSILQERVQVDDKKIDNLVQIYSTMKPQQAAKSFEDMDEALAIEILGRMKKKNAAEIMNLVKSEKVKVLSEKYAGYKRN